MPGLRPILRDLIVLAALSLLGFALYSNVINGPFIMDDYMYIADNAGVKDLSNFTAFRGTRYLAYLSFALNFALGGEVTTGYHLFNIGLHIANSFMVYLITGFIFRSPLFSDNDGSKRLGKSIAFAAALIFLTHPLQTQAVSYISQRLASFAAFFYLLSLSLYMKFRLKEFEEGKKAWGFFVLALLSTIAAQKTKEITFTLPVMIVLFEAAFFSGIKGALRRASLLPFLACLLIIPFELFAIELGLRGASASVDDFIISKQVSELKGISSYEYLLTQFRVLITYLRLLILPAGQSFVYNYALYKSLLQPAVIASFLFLLALLGSAFFMAYRSIKRRAFGYFLIPLGVFWFFITSSIESSVIPIKDVIFEHRMYLPIAGLIFSFTAALFYFFSKRGKNGFYISWAIVLATAVVFSIATYKRNMVWADEVVFWEDNLKKAPGVPDAHELMGEALVRAGRYGEAEAHYLKAIELDPKHLLAHKNLAWAYRQMNRPNDELAVCERIAELSPDDFEARYNIGSILLRFGMYAQAEARLKEALALNPNDPELHVNIGNAIYRQGRREEAIEEYRMALSIDPENQLAIRNLEVILKTQQR